MYVHYTTALFFVNQSANNVLIITKMPAIGYMFLLIQSMFLLDLFTIVTIARNTLLIHLQNSATNVHNLPIIVKY